MTQQGYVSFMNIIDDKIQIGDLVMFEPWDCEGIEQPYGYKVFDKRDWDPFKKKMLEKLSGRCKITPGAKGLVTGREEVVRGNHTEVMLWCLVQEGQLLVSTRFISRLF